MAKRIVLIDPGHGAETPGKRSPDGLLREYEFNRDVARRLQKKLQASGIDARLTVTDDTDMPLIKRTNLARELKRRGYDVLLVSIHANAAGSGWGPAHGIETFTNDQAQQLADILQQKLVELTGLSNRGVKRADLHITRESGRHGIPGILTELGFMTNRDECSLLKTSDYREKCATALAVTICEYWGVIFHESTDNSQKEQVNVDNSCAIEVNGKILAVRGILSDGKSFLPVRAVAEAVGKGAVVGWHDASKTVTLNGKALASLKIIGGTGYAWSQEIAAALGLMVEWDGETKTVKLKGCV
ncbi:N-acetylmuramoyl-L-alanine amidase [Brevibacillus sp. H7]|uniref:N-acetylmuramoyl-L-alanine amidase n=1 Tax=Brevibacillus sp. H7 TaxID=3349138 RepID=UPI003809BA2B